MLQLFSPENKDVRPMKTLQQYPYLDINVEKGKKVWFYRDYQLLFNTVKHWSCSLERSQNNGINVCKTDAAEFVFP